MKASQHSETLVIGGGLAGSMAALRLAGEGRDVLLLERESTAHHKVCGEFLSPEAVRYLRYAGLDPLALGAAPIQHLRLCCGEKTVHTRLPFTALSLSRHVLDSALQQQARQTGCCLCTGTSVETLQRDGKSWMAQTRSPGSSLENCIRAENIFLATGKHDLRGWQRPPGRQNDLIGFKMHWRLTSVQSAALRGWMDLFLFRGGYGGLSLIENGLANLCLVVRRGELRVAGTWDNLLAIIRSQTALLDTRLAAAQPQWSRPLAISSIPYGYLAAASHNYWRIGDQAAVIPSFTGDGMAIALHSGSLAADIHLAGRTPEAYAIALRQQLTRGMSLATGLSRAMVTSAGRSIAPAALTLLPGAMSWIARLTRIPERALLDDLSKAAL